MASASTGGTPVASSRAVVSAVLVTMLGGLLCLFGGLVGTWLAVVGLALFLVGVVMVMILSFRDARRTDSSPARALGRAVEDGLRWIWQMAP